MLLPCDSYNNNNNYYYYYFYLIRLDKSSYNTLTAICDSFIPSRTSEEEIEKLIKLHSKSIYNKGLLQS